MTNGNRLAAEIAKYALGAIIAIGRYLILFVATHLRSVNLSLYTGLWRI
jgi:hypothetical protein